MAIIIITDLPSEIFLALLQLGDISGELRPGSDHNKFGA